MSRLDIVIFGATGFTGKKAVEELVRVAKKYGVQSWGIAGRSQKKLDDLLSDISKKTGEDLSHVKVIIADVNDESSLKAMCAATRVLASCCGPYRFHGEAVVAAALAAHCHYVDVSGETVFMEKMQLNYDDLARESGVYAVSACGFDSIPNDMGVIYLQQNFNGTVNSVESYISSHVAPEYSAEAAKSALIHYGTWDSLVHGIAFSGELAPLRKKLYPERLPSFKPKLEPRSTIHKRDNNYCLPFPGADNSIVYRTQRHLYEKEHKRPVQFKAYIELPSLKATLMTILGGVMLYAMSMMSFTRSLLLKYPKLFSFGVVSHEGPSEVVMNNTHFTMTLHGEGWSRGVDPAAASPDKQITVKVKGVNPGYGATVTALVFSAITILKESDKMPGTGGVLTPGVAFQNTDLIKHLNDNNLTFQVVENK